MYSVFKINVKDLNISLFEHIKNEFSNKEIEIIVHDIGSEKTDKEKNIPIARGILSRYANPELIELEQKAWIKALWDKYGNS